MPTVYVHISWFSCCLGASLLVWSPSARGNGAFPEVSQLVSDPSDATHLLLRSTFGLLTTRDRGQNWDLVCEAGIGYQNIEPPVAVLDDGSTIAALSEGIAHGDPSTCEFEVAQGVNAYVADVSRVPGVPGHAVAVSVDIANGASQVWQSEDDGATWATLGNPLTGLSAATLDVSAVDANVVYVSGSSASSSTNGVLARSNDGGQSWLRFPVPGSNKLSAPYIAALPATDTQTVYVRLSGTPGQLLVTHDGGQHFDALLSFAGPFDGFALSPDGRYALASGRVDGVWRAPTSTLAFEQLSCAKLRCLSWSEAGLFACADEFEAGFLVGESSDLGLSFDPLLHLSCVRGPLACDASTSVGALCPQAWPAISEQLGTDCASAGSFMPSTLCRDAGSPSDAAAPNNDAGADGGEPNAAVPSTAPHGGCACSVGENQPANEWGWLPSLACCGGLGLRKIWRNRRRSP